jgi:hypothetical protein
MNKIVPIMFAACFALVSAQDEFFQPGSSIGGYGELHWNKAADADGNETKNMFDFHRFIIYYGYNWTENWSFKSEVELEHNFVKDGHGELELEQAYVNYHAGNWGFQGGVILPTGGLINEYHEPPLFLSVERPAYSKYIIPTTWFGNGFALYGNYSGVNFRVVIMEDLEGEGIFKKGNIRGGRGKGFETTGISLLKNISTSYTGINGLRLGGSLSLNNAPLADINDDASPDSTIAVQLFEINAKYDANNIYTVFEYGKSEFKYDGASPPTYLNNDGETVTWVDFSSSGYYLDLGYNIGDMVGCNKLIPWVRVSNVSKNDDVASKQTDYLRFGLTWWPINNVAFKSDFANVTNDGTTTTEFNIGIGYNF